ncbi:MAG: DNA repair protein RecO [Pyrinomonadaceae bacterium]
MPLIETECVVLKTYNLAEADRIVVLLTRDHGLVRGVAKGAKRLKSKFGSALEPYSVVTATYFEKDSVELVSIQQIDLVQSSFAAAGNPHFLQKFSYLTELVIATLPPHDPNETLYRMVKACIETAMADGGTIDAVAVYFALWLLRLSGYMPDWNICEVCSRPFAESESAALVSSFQLACLRCRSASVREIDASMRSIVIAARRLTPPQFSAFSSASSESLSTLSVVMRQIISHSIGRQLPGEVSLAGEIR